MAMRCDRKGTCENPYKDTVVILDSSALFHVLQAFVKSIPNNTPNHQLFHSFRWQVENIFPKISLCPRIGRFIVEKQVYLDEMDFTNPASTIRNEAVFINICDNQNNNFNEIGNKVSEKVRIDDGAISDPEIATLQRLANSGPNVIYRRPSKNDFIQIALAFKLSNQGSSVILSDDTHLRDALENICSQRYVTLSTARYDTSRVSSTSTISFFENNYSCCRYDVNEYFALIDILDNFVKELAGTNNPIGIMYDENIQRICRHIAEFNK
jgi:hypothetical protein